MKDKDDIRIHYSHALAFDPVQGKSYSTDICRYCYHPKVMQKYGENVRLSNYTCKNCMYVSHNDMGYIECGYKPDDKERKLTNDDIQAVLSN